MIHGNAHVFRWKRPQKFPYKTIILILQILIILFFLRQRCTAAVFIIDDYSFTNQEYNYDQVHDFLKKIPTLKLTDNQIRFLYNNCEYFNIHPLAALAFMEKESGIIYGTFTETRYTKLLNLCMGYGLYCKKRLYGAKFYEFYSYDIQVFLTIKKLRFWFDSWKPSKQIHIINLNKKMAVDNSATYAVLIMTPFLGTHTTYDRTSGGAETFGKIYNRMLTAWCKN
jgi:hypothetical protein